MVEPERKRRGPIGWLVARTRRFWIAVALLPVLYVASFGPMRTVAVRNEFIRWANGNVTLNVVQSDWCQPAYRPLIWASQQSWGEPLSRYWRLFPVREIRVVEIPATHR